MQHSTPLFILVAAAAVMASGCDKKRTTSQQLDSVQAKAEKVAENIGNQTVSTKDEFVRAERAKLAGLNRDLDELAGKVEKSSDPVKAEAKERIITLRAQTARLNNQLDEAANVTESNWEQFKTDIRKTQAASKEEFDKARQWLSDKIAP